MRVDFFYTFDFSYNNLKYLPFRHSGEGQAKTGIRTKISLDNAFCIQKKPKCIFFSSPHALKEKSIFRPGQRLALPHRYTQIPSVEQNIHPGRGEVV